MNDDNIVRFRSRDELAAEAHRDEIAEDTGISGKVVTHDQLMAMDPEKSPAAVKVYQDYYNNQDS